MSQIKQPLPNLLFHKNFECPLCHVAEKSGDNFLEKFLSSFPVLTLEALFEWHLEGECSRTLDY